MRARGRGGDCHVREARGFPRECHCVFVRDGELMVGGLFGCCYASLVSSQEKKSG